jgi:Na+/melibiose symporter-like transporter
VTVWGGEQYAWTSATIIGLAVAGVVLTGLFLLQERRAAEPLLPLGLFRNGIFNVASGVSFLIGLAMFGGIIFLPLYFQIVTGASATSSGLLMLPMVTGLLGASIMAGRITTSTGRYRIFPILGMVCSTVAFLLLSRLDVDTARVESSAYIFLLGVGVGLVMQTVILATQNAVPQSLLGVATSGVTFFRSMGGAFGVALFGTILNNRLDHYVVQNVPADALAALGSPPGHELGKSREVILGLPDAVRDGVIQSFADGLHVVFLLAVPVCIVALALTWFLKEIPLRGYGEAHASDETGAAAKERPPVLVEL